MCTRWCRLGRSWRRLRRRPRATQVRTAVIIVAIVVGLVAWLVLAPSGSGGGVAGAAEPALNSSSTATPPSQADTSTRGVSKTAINVVFPVVAINSEAGQARLRPGQGVQRADDGDPPLREPGERQRGDQRAQDQPDDRTSSTRPTTPTCNRSASNGPRGARPSSRSSTVSGRGSRTTSSASPSRGTRRSSAPGRPRPTGRTSARRTCGGRAPTWPRSCPPPCNGA